MDLTKALAISARGMDVQGTRLRVIAENLANQDTTGSKPGAEAYRRKTVSFENRVDRSLGTEAVRVKQIGRDKSELPLKYDPSHPAANADGPDYTLTGQDGTDYDIDSTDGISGITFGDGVHLIVTDSGIRTDQRQSFERAGVQVLVV